MAITRNPEVSSTGSGLLRLRLLEPVSVFSVTCVYGFHAFQLIHKGDQKLGDMLPSHCPTLHKCMPETHALNTRKPPAHPSAFVTPLRHPETEGRGKIISHNEFFYGEVLLAQH